MTHNKAFKADGAAGVTLNLDMAVECERQWGLGASVGTAA